MSLPRLGFGLPVSGGWATSRTMIDIARRAEALGYASLWTFQRVLHPAPGGLDPAYDAAHNPGARSATDDSYQQVHDALLPLAHVASHTSRIGLGTATVCAPFTAPALLAKAYATLDHLSDGRVTAGVGIGWLPHEYAAAGVPMTRRGERMEEYLRCLVAMWGPDPVSFVGEHYRVPPAHTGLKPVQTPHPPILVGGSAEPALRRAGRLAQGWIGSTREDLAEIGRQVSWVRAGAEEAGRDPDAVRVLVRVVPELTEDDPGPGRARFHGTREQLIEDLDGLSGQGVTEVLLDLNLSHRVGSPGVPEERGAEVGVRLLEALAPGR